MWSAFPWNYPALENYDICGAFRLPSNSHAVFLHTIECPRRFRCVYQVMRQKLALCVASRNEPTEDGRLQVITSCGYVNVDSHFPFHSYSNRALDHMALCTVYPEHTENVDYD